MKIGITCTLRSGNRRQANAATPLDDDEEEFDSPETVEAVGMVLRSLGHEIELLGDGEELLRKLLKGPRPDFVFNFAEGRGADRSREARVPAVLEMLGIPYTGSDPLTLAVTLDKDCGKRLAQAAGIATPQWVLVDGDVAEFRQRLAELPLPAFIKPAYEGSSKGVLPSSLIGDREELLAAVAKMRTLYRQPILVEEFIDGDELTVGLIGNGVPDVIGVMRVLPLKASGPFVYSLEVKRDWEHQVRYECPAQLRPADTEAVRQAALGVWRALGCRDVARVDFRLRDGVPYFLEVNPLPGLSPKSSDIILMGKAVGVDHREIVTRILQAAVERLEAK